jgi:hypothetical protein
MIAACCIAKLVKISFARDIHTGSLKAYFLSLCEGMVIPFRPEWNGHSIPEWNGMIIPLCEGMVIPFHSIPLACASIYVSDYMTVDTNKRQILVYLVQNQLKAYIIIF